MFLYTILSRELSPAPGALRLKLLDFAFGKIVLRENTDNNLTSERRRFAKGETRASM
jgi:hypothetical protein